METIAFAIRSVAKTLKARIVVSSNSLLGHEGSVASSKDIKVRGMLIYLGGSLFVHAKGVLDLVTTVKRVNILKLGLKTRQVLHGAAGTTVSLVVVGALGLVKGLLGSALVLVGLTTTSHAVGGVGDSLLDLVLGGLGGVRSHLLLCLCRRDWSVSKEEMRDGCDHILVVKSLRPVSDMMIV